MDCNNCHRESEELYCSQACKFEDALLSDNQRLLHSMLSSVAGDNYILDADLPNRLLFVDVKEEAVDEVDTLLQAIRDNCGWAIDTTEQNGFEQSYIVSVRV